MVHGASGGPVMCAYKLCYVEFRYWGMQSKIERFIHDTGIVCSPNFYNINYCQHSIPAFQFDISASILMSQYSVVFREHPWSWG